MAEPALPVINMLWIGGKLGHIERLSVVSFLAAGHRVDLHAYDEVRDVPAGAQLVDASLTTPQQVAMRLRHRKTGSYALASDYFRLQLQAQGKGMWADADMVALAPFRFSGPNVFGYESEGTLNGAVLHLPADSPIAGEMLAGFVPNSVPWWVTERRKRDMALRRFLHIPFGPQDHSWGVFGPRGLTALAERHGLLGAAQPVDVFYPVPYGRAREVFAPGSTLDAFVSERTLGVHLWNNMLGELRAHRPAADSAVGRLLARFGV